MHSLANLQLLDASSGSTFRNNLKRMSFLRRKDLLVVVTTAMLAAAVPFVPPFSSFQGVSIDILTALRWRLFGNSHAAQPSPSVVVALDEESYRTPPFANSPNLAWTREIGRVVEAVIEGGAEVVGFDVIFPTSIEQAEVPFGEGTLGDRVRGFDRDFLRQLALGARAGKIVLGQVQHQSEPITPSPGQRIAVGHQKNIRALNAYTDPDEVIRRLPLSFLIDGETSPSMAVELASRAKHKTIRVDETGSTYLGDYLIPTTVPNTFALNFEGGGTDIPTYSLADLRACIETGNADFFRRNFSGKVVLIGVMLDVEDRKITSKRYATGTEGAQQQRCVFAQKSLAPVVRDTISGVFVHATGVNNLINNDVLRELGPEGRYALSLVIAIMSGLLAMRLAPVRLAFTFLALSGAFLVLGSWLLRHAVVVPVVDSITSAMIVGIAITAYRFIVADKDKRLLRRSFGLYLAPQIVDQMVETGAAPSLGGEMRNVTIFFSDIAGFTAISERTNPSDLVTLMNEYLSAMTDTIEAHKGFVDKYIGDAIVAVFGAPVDDDMHAMNAVTAALACERRLREFNNSSSALERRQLSQRIGIHTGDVVVGNVGSQRRFNYTVIGDAVNLASRLEGANKYFGTSIIASDITVQRTGDHFRWRELDIIRVKGREQPLTIFEPVGIAGQPGSVAMDVLAAYREGLLAWRRREPSVAADAFSSVADVDVPSARFAARARKTVAALPDEWVPVNLLEGK
jgi:class 3 adenylate cyclase/CHASE2 domain-containing sensor protein